MATKRNYHPLVQYFYYGGLLNTNQLCCIPSTTIAYWNKNRPETMYGSDWVSNFSADVEELSKTQRHRIIAKATRKVVL
jgi:hypothetical protein